TVFPLMGMWGFLIAATAWWRYRRSLAAPEIPRRPISTVLAEGIPAIGLLISVICGAVEWEYIFEGQGRWWVGLLWLAGVAASILAARQNRRTTVIMVPRGGRSPHHRSHRPANAFSTCYRRRFRSSPSLVGEILAQQP